MSSFTQPNLRDMSSYNHISTCNVCNICSNSIICNICSRCITFILCSIQYMPYMPYMQYMPYRQYVQHMHGQSVQSRNFRDMSSHCVGKGFYVFVETCHRSRRHISGTRHHIGTCHLSRSQISGTCHHVALERACTFSWGHVTIPVAKSPGHVIILRWKGLLRFRWDISSFT